MAHGNWYGSSSDDSHRPRACHDSARRPFPPDMPNNNCKSLEAYPASFLLLQTLIALPSQTLPTAIAGRPTIRAQATAAALPSAPYLLLLATLAPLPSAPDLPLRRAPALRAPATTRPTTTTHHLLLPPATAPPLHPPPTTAPTKSAPPAETNPRAPPATSTATTDSASAPVTGLQEPPTRSVLLADPLPLARIATVISGMILATLTLARTIVTPVIGLRRERCRGRTFRLGTRLSAILPPIVSCVTIARVVSMLRVPSVATVRGRARPVSGGGITEWCAPIKMQR